MITLTLFSMFGCLGVYETLRLVQHLTGAKKKEGAFSGYIICNILAETETLIQKASVQAEAQKPKMPVWKVLTLS